MHMAVPAMHSIQYKAVAVRKHVVVPAGIKKQYKYEAVAVPTGTKWQCIVYNIYIATVMPIMGTARDVVQYHVAAISQQQRQSSINNMHKLFFSV